MSPETLAPLPVVIPLACAALLAAVNELVPRWFTNALTLAATAAAAAAALMLTSAANSGLVIHWFGGWTPQAGVSLGIDFAVDPLGAGLAALTAILMLAALVFSLRYFDPVGTIFGTLMLVFLAGMEGFCLTGDLFNLFVFFELMSAAAFALCGYKIEELESVHGTLNFAVTNTIGAFLALTGVALLYGRTGALNLAQIGRALGPNPDATSTIAFAFILCGFLVKAAVAPFHFWLPDAHAVAPTPVCVLFSGVMVELGLYGPTRVYWAAMSRPGLMHEAAFRGLLLSVGAVTALLGAVMCFSQRNIKRLLAFSTVSHMGLFLIGVGALSAHALAGTALYVLSHGLVKGALFIAAGITLHQLGDVDEWTLRGRGKNTPVVGALFLIGALGLIGLAPFGTFTAHHELLEALRESGSDLAWVFYAASIVTAAAVLRVWLRVFSPWPGPEGGEKPGGRHIKEERETTSARPAYEMHAAAAVLLAASLACGLCPNLRQKAGAAAARFVDTPSYQARVLEGESTSTPAPEPPKPIPWKDVAISLACAAGAFALAWTAPRLKQSQTRWLARAMAPLHALQSGNAADYAAFLVAGAALFGWILK